MSDAFILYSSQGTFLAHNKLDVFLVQNTEHYYSCFLRLPHVSFKAYTMETVRLDCPSF